MRRVVAAASAAVFALAACSSSGGSSTPLTDKFGLTPAGATQSLLAESQLPGGLAVKAGDRTELPLPCTPKAGSVTAQFHARALARRTFEDPLGTFQITEIVSNYPGKATTVAAAKAIIAGLGCGDAYIGRFAVTITGPQNVTKLTTPVDGAQLWSLKAAGAEQVVIVAQLGTQLVQLLFASTGAVKGGVDPSAIAQQAVARVSATINS